MSIGNNKSEGNKGYNFPYQSKVLKGLQQIADNTDGGASEVTLKVVATALASLIRVPNIIRTSAAGTITPAVFDFSVANVGVADGTILGVPNNILPGETLSFSAGAMNNYYPANSITYDGTGTELVIIYNS